MSSLSANHYYYVAAQQMPPLTCLVLYADWQSLYPYTADLVNLDLCRPARPRVHPLHRLVCSPLDGRAWAEVLGSHPDKAFVRFVLRGLQEGFRIGSAAPPHYNRPHVTCCQPSSTRRWCGDTWTKSVQCTAC